VVLGRTLWTVKPWYRELNIMNRVLNKDFELKSCNNSTLIAFSGVFHPAYCMQNFPVNEREGSAGRSFRLYEVQEQKNPVHPAKENLMRSSNAC
jgi:hypothetical protein